MARTAYLLLALFLSALERGLPQPGPNPRLNFFDIDLLRLAAEDRRGNVVISPASVKSALAMLLEGSHGETADELRRALRLSPERDEFREQLNFYLATLQANTSDATLENANGVFVSDKLNPRASYRQMLQHVYYSELMPLDFTDPTRAAATINSWVSGHTHGLIPTLVEPFSIAPTSSMVILNALYFKSNWRTAFEPKHTRPGCFYHKDSCHQVATMHLQAELGYAMVDALRAHAVELPYQGDRYSAMLLVPRDRDGCLSVIRDLPYMSLDQVADLMEPTDVQLSLPRFSVDYNVDLVPVLKDARIHRIFSSAANFSNIFEGHEAPQVNNMFHRTHVEVSESGTLAAAATGALVVPLIGSTSVQLRVDRPFLFFIRDKVTGAVLFEGKIEEPEAVSQPPASPPPPPSPQANGTPAPPEKSSPTPQVSPALFSAAAQRKLG